MAHDLTLSLGDPSTLRFSPECEAETRRRVELVRCGNAAGRPAAEVFADREARLQ